MLENYRLGCLYRLLNGLDPQSVRCCGHSSMGCMRGGGGLWHPQM